MRTDTAHELSTTVMDLLLDRPFFGHLAGALARAADDGLPAPLALRIGTGRFVLTASPTLFAALTRAQRAVAAEHELLHLVLGHPARAPDHADVPELFVAACDIVVNQLLSGGKPLPGWITLASLPPAVRRPGLTVEEYLAILRRLYPAGRLPRAGGGCCAGGAAGALAGSHPWAGADRRDRTAAQLASAGFEPLLIAAARRQSHRSWGRLPARLRSHLQALLDSHGSGLDWRRVLRMFAASSRRNRIRGTLRRPSRRYHTFPGLRVARGQRLAVCVDTSGSIGDDMLGAFFAEIHQIWRAGAEVTVLEIDATLQRSYEYAGTPPQSVDGRGGTSFEPGLVAVRGAVPRFDAAVYLTDGHGPRPATSPGIPLLWLVTPDGDAGPHLAFGSHVRMR